MRTDPQKRESQFILKEIKKLNAMLDGSEALEK